jgi:hypothetical protein
VRERKLNADHGFIYGWHRYLVKSARVAGKLRITSQEVPGHRAEELAAAMNGGLGLPDRIHHKDFAAVATA